MVLTAMHHGSTFAVHHGDALEVSVKAKDKCQLMVRLKPAVKTWVERKSSEQERSQTWLIEKILEQAMIQEARECA